MSNITIQKRKVIESDGMVILTVKEYRRLIEQDVPTYYLKGKAARDLDKLVEEGLKEYREGRTIKASSVAEALALYGKRRKHRN